MQAIIEEIAEAKINYIILNELQVPFQLCKKLFSLQSLDSESKQQLFSQLIGDFTEQECKDSLKILGCEELLSSCIGKRPKIPATDINHQILDAMVKKHWIINFDVDKKDAHMYRISSKRKERI